MACDMWFGTQDYMTWVPTPLSGADVSPNAWSNNGTLLNGGGYAMNSFNSHKRYNFSWRQSSTRETAQTMKSFYDGTFGRGKLFFLDPLTLDTNVLPARWADPSITCDFEGPDLIPGVDPVRVSQTNTSNLRLPVKAAQFNLALYTQTRREDAGVFIPIPPGHVLLFSYFGTADTSDPDAPHVRVGYVTPGGGVVAPTRINPVTPTTKNQNGDGVVEFPGSQGFIGVQVWIGGANAGDVVTGSITVNAMQAVIMENATRANVWKNRHYDGWIGGQGHSGARFAQPPTYLNHSPINGGQVEFAASFIESVI